MKHSDEIIASILWHATSWMLVTIALGVGLIALARKKNFLREEGIGWATVLLVLNLFFVTAPLVSAPLGAHAGAMASVEIINRVSDKLRLTKLDGMALLLPLSLTYSEDPEQLARIKRVDGGQSDVAYLLDEPTRQRLLFQLDPERTRQIYDELQVAVRLPKDLPIPRSLVELALHHGFGEVSRDRELFDTLTRDLVPNAKGQLPLESAALQVGKRFHRDHFAELTSRTVRPWLLISILSGIGEFFLLFFALSFLSRRPTKNPALHAPDVDEVALDDEAGPSA